VWRVCVCVCVCERLALWLCRSAGDEFAGLLAFLQDLGVSFVLSF
jgi:hypothetical protein